MIPTIVNDRHAYRCEYQEATEWTVSRSEHNTRPLAVCATLPAALAAARLLGCEYVYASAWNDPAESPAEYNARLDKVQRMAWAAASLAQPYDPLTDYSRETRRHRLGVVS